jgi:hypothetical protein
MRNFCPDLPLCQEASNCSSLHPSERFSSMYGRHSVFDQLWDFFPKHRYGKIAATVRTTWIPVRTYSSIRRVAHSKFRRSDDSLMVRTHKLLIWKLRASDQPSGQPFQWSRRAKPWYGNCVQLKCDRPDDRATPSERSSNQEFHRNCTKSIA